MKLAHRVAALVVPAVAACSSPSPTPKAGASEPPAVSPPPVTDVSNGSSSPVFDVHEWGLVDVQSTTAAGLVAGPPSGQINWNAPRRKPVLYFHLADGTKSVDTTVTVTTPAMGFAEVFPKGVLTSEGRTLTWSGLHVRNQGCHVVGAPLRDAPECRTPDGLCEAVELPNYEAADASCIDASGGSFNHLFYRANGPPPQLPFEVVAKGAQLSITHARATDTVGPILYVHHESGTVTVTTIATPPVGQSVSADPPKETDVGPAIAALDSEMKQVGLSDAEARAFDRAWSNDLFGRAGAREAPARRGMIAPQDYLLFPMPASLVNGASTVTIAPPPRALRRFMLVRLRV